MSLDCPECLARILCSNWLKFKRVLVLYKLWKLFSLLYACFVQSMELYLVHAQLDIQAEVQTDLSYRGLLEHLPPLRYSVPQIPVFVSTQHGDFDIL